MLSRSKNPKKIPSYPGYGYTIIHSDGRVLWNSQRPNLDIMHKALRCECIDGINLGNDFVMVVDDSGIIDGKPVNSKAMEIVAVMLGEKYPHKVCGDVVITLDSYFAKEII